MDPHEDALSVHLMGGPYLLQRGCRVDLPDGVGRLLAFVILHNGNVRRSYTAGALWPEANQMRATRNLRSALWRLRGAGLDVLRADAQRVGLCPEAAVDIDELSAWSSRLIRGRPVARDIDAPPVDMLAVEFLPCYEDDWVSLERERLRQRLLHGTEALVRHLLDARRYAQAADVATALVATEPERGSARLLLARANLAREVGVEAMRRGLVRLES